MTTQHLESLIYEFTQPHTVRYHIPGKDEYHQVLPLLDQLESIKNERRNGAGGGGYKAASSCINQDALQIQIDIEKEICSSAIASWYAQIKLEIKGALPHWARTMHPEDATKILEQWKQRIHALTEIWVPINTQCPQCGSIKIMRTVDGETKISPAILINTATETAECQACRTLWEGQETWHEIAKTTAPYETTRTA